MSRARSSDGFTLVEVLAALFVALAVIGALAVVLASNDNSSLAAQLQISRLSVLQQQIEKVRNVVSQYGFSALALNAEPGAPTPADPTNPNNFITGYGTANESFLVQNNYNNTSEGLIDEPPGGEPANGEPLLDPNTGSTGGQVTPVQCVDLSDPNSSSSCGGLASGSDPYVTIYTYITQTNAVGCKANANCTGDARRVVVAALLHHPGSPSKAIGPNTPTYSTVVITNPLASDYPGRASGLELLGLIR